MSIEKHKAMIAEISRLRDVCMTPRLKTPAEALEDFTSYIREKHGIVALTTEAGQAYLAKLRGWPECAPILKYLNLLG